LIQRSKQYGPTSNAETGYQEIIGDSISPSVSTEGIVVFDPIDHGGDNFNVIFEGISENLNVRTEPFTFEIPLKHEVVAKPNTNKVPLTEPTQLVGNVKEEANNNETNVNDQTQIDSKTPTANNELTGVLHFVDPNNSLNEVSVHSFLSLERKIQAEIWASEGRS
jgi:hypothetical protein